MIGLSGIELKILELSMDDGYSPFSDGPWWMRFLFHSGLMDRYLRRLCGKGLLMFFHPGLDMGFSFSTTLEGYHVLNDYWTMMTGIDEPYYIVG